MGAKLMWCNALSAEIEEHTIRHTQIYCNVYILYLRNISFHIHTVKTHCAVYLACYQIMCIYVLQGFEGLLKRSIITSANESTQDLDICSDYTVYLNRQPTHFFWMAQPTYGHDLSITILCTHSTPTKCILPKMNNSGC